MLRRLVDRRRQRPDGTRGAETLHGFVRLALAAALERIGGQRANAHSRAGSSAVGRELWRAVDFEGGHARWEGESDAPKGRLCDLSATVAASSAVRDRYGLGASSVAVQLPPAKLLDLEAKNRL